MNRRKSEVIGALALSIGAMLLPLRAAGGEAVPLSALSPIEAEQGWGQLQIDRGVGGKPLAIAGRAFAQGLGTHAASELIYELDGDFTNFTAWVGVDDFLKDHPESPKASVVFEVFVDGAKRFDSGVMKIGDAARQVQVSVAGAQELRLVVTDAGDGISCDHADWAEAELGGQRSGVSVQRPVHEVKSAGLTIKLDEQGRIAGSSLMDLTGQTRLGGCRVTGDIAVARGGGGYAFTRTVADAQGHHATVTDRFTPDGEGIRWEVEIASDDAPWSAPITTTLACGQPERMRFWTAWGAPPDAAGPWTDPLQTSPFVTRSWHYGNVAQSVPTGGDYIALPLATLVDPARDRGLSLVLSPEDVLLNLDLAVSAGGQLRLTRTHHRLGGGKPMRFTAHLVPHEASWRGGLRFLTGRYAAFFDPPNPRAHQLAGCGAYSTGEQPIDIAKFKRMAFGFNWKLSDDFPYMGMFVPPVTNADQTWTRSCDEASAAYKGPTSSCRQMNDYARYLRTNGFAVLSYFNVTEFGKKMYGRQPVKQAGDPDLWQDPVAYLRAHLPHAVFDPGIQTCYSAYITDVGDPDYGRFMLEQAERNTRLLPDTAGICIDRADWLRLYNRTADDGVSWVDGKPARALFRSWIDFMARLGPQMHRADKVIFSNLMTMRLELGRELDGIYTEFGNNGHALNASALLGLRKPVVAWTYNETLRQPNPDAFMQRHLHLGCFPTAPYPYNNHCINPEPAADQLYQDYGTLLDALRGKTWVLAPRAVACETAKVNLFATPTGYALPVTFGGTTGSVEVVVRNVPDLAALHATVLHPGQTEPALVAAVTADDHLTLNVPLVRGCALVVLKK